MMSRWVLCRAELVHLISDSGVFPFARPSELLSMLDEQFMKAFVAVLATSG